MSGLSKMIAKTLQFGERHQLNLVFYPKLIQFPLNHYNLICLIDKATKSSFQLYYT